MKYLNNIYIKENTIFSKGPSSPSYSFIKQFIKNQTDIKSFLDIGCGDGILMDLMKKNIDYLGVDANAGIKKINKNSKIKYFKTPNKTDNYLNRLKKKFNCVAIMDVLEHTDTFTKLFNIALKKSNKYVVVSLPNEDYLISRLRFLFGQGILTHGLDLVGSKAGHKHQWLIQYKLAKKILNSEALKKKFKLDRTMYYVGLPQTFYKRQIYKFILFFFPKRIQMNEFCFIFKKKN